jgi:hypothetical protein
MSILHHGSVRRAVASSPQTIRPARAARVWAAVRSLAVAVGAVTLLTAVAQAAPQRFVSASGNDANPCTREAPCRTLQRGHDATPAGGTLLILDTAGYGSPLAISKSITIAAHGAVATLSGRGNIRINGSGAIVVLRGLLLSGTDAHSGTNGVTISDAAAVHIENCVIERFTAHGVSLSTGSSIELFVADSVMRDNGASGLIAQGASAKLTVVRSRFENNGSTGLSTNAEAAITDSTASGNGIYGFSVFSGGRLTGTRLMAAYHGLSGYVASGSAAVLMLDSSVGHGNQRGLQVESSNGTPNSASVSNSVFTENQVGIQNGTDGIIRSRGNNTVVGNDDDVDGTITALGGL